jgi:NAD-dependent dihydropyrimidine dehydrogenase PreA subunit
MIYFQVNSRCNGCLACLQNCPADAIAAKDSDGKRKLLHNMARCARCGNCWRICPEQAIEFQHMLTNEWDEVVELDLIACRICGEPLYTQAFREALGRKTAVSETPLCSKHKEALTLKVKTHFAGCKQDRMR